MKIWKIKGDEYKVPRKNINAEERLDTKWSADYIRMLMQQLKAMREGEEPVEKPKRNFKKKK